MWARINIHPAFPSTNIAWWFDGGKESTPRIHVAWVSDVLNERINEIGIDNKLDSVSYKMPPEASWIKIITDNSPFSITLPQCAETSEGSWMWVYNFAWAVQLGKFLQRKLPSVELFVESINANPELFRDNLGFRSEFGWDFIDKWASSYYWTCDEFYSTDAHYVSLNSQEFRAHSEVNYRNRWLQVRFVRE